MLLGWYIVEEYWVELGGCPGAKECENNLSKQPVVHILVASVLKGCDKSSLSLHFLQISWWSTKFQNHSKRSDFTNIASEATNDYFWKKNRLNFGFVQNQHYDLKVKFGRFWAILGQKLKYFKNHLKNASEILLPALKNLWNSFKMLWSMIWKQTTRNQKKLFCVAKK